MNKIRKYFSKFTAFFSSLLFVIFINLWGALIPIIYFPVFFVKDSSRLADHGAKIWAAVIIFVLKKLCKIDYEIVGMEKIPNTPCIIACKHQSAWETIVMHLVVSRPAYAYKKELTKIPFYGWYLGRMTGIKVDRSGGASALKSLLKQSKDSLKNGHYVVLFPQGTRVPPFAGIDEYPYQAGVDALYLSCGVPVVPAALNSGLFWGKHKMLKKPGKIILEFLDPIAPGLNRSEFNARLSSSIETKSLELLKTK